MNDSPKPVYRIADLATDERPRERLAHLGAQALSTSELVGILLRVGVPGENAVQVGQRLLTTFKGISVCTVPLSKNYATSMGLVRLKAAQLKAAIELGRRLALETPEERPAVNCPADAADLVKYDMSALEQERTINATEYRSFNEPESWG